jgi:Arc/MetJ family transcription regulator
VWYRVYVATNLALDDRLLEEAVKIGGKTTKKAAVTEALQEYIARRKQARLVDIFGTIDYDPAYHYKAQRKRR